MSLGLVSALLERRDPVEERTLTPAQLAWDRGEDLGTFNSAVGTQVSRDTMLGVSAVWACISLIADTVATLPLGAYTDQDGAPVRATQPSWLTEPNPEQTITDFKFGTVASLLLHGNAYVYVVRDRKQNPVELWLLDPRWVYVRREPDENGNLALFYYVQVGKGMQSPVGPFRVKAGPEMFHIMAFQPSSSWPMGIGPLDVAQLTFGGAIAANEMAARFFGSGFNASGAIKVPDDLTPDQAKILKRDFRDANAGVKKMHLPPVLTGGADWIPMNITQEQSQFLQQRQFGVDEIARWFRVPPHMIGNLEKTSSWGAGIEQQAIGFITYTLRPWLDRIEQSWTRNLLTWMPGAFLQFDVLDLMRGDMTALADFATKMHMTGNLNATEFRSRYLRLPSYEGSDTYYFAVNTAPIGTDPILLQKTKVDIPGEDPAPVGPADQPQDPLGAGNGNGNGRAFR